VAVGEGGGRPSSEQIRERLVKGLGLDEEQQRKLDPILADAREQMRGLQGLSDQERQARARKIREEARTRIRAILTDAQRARYDELAGGEGRGDGRGTPGRVWALQGDKLRAVPVTLGITDGTATEILRGDLQEGQEVVVGMAGASGGPRSGPGAGPRLRL
jgi:HlyD family secretion protein